MSIAQKSLDFTGIFEAEVMTELLLWRWNHPLKDNAEFREELLEGAAVALRRAVSGESLIDSLPASETNLVAAIYYAEWSAVSAGDDDPAGLRQQWLEQLRVSIPSCFCSQEDLLP